MLANQLLDSVNPGHIELSDQSDAKRLMMVIKAKHAHIQFHLDKLCVQMIDAVTFTVCSELKIG